MLMKRNNSCPSNGSIKVLKREDQINKWDRRKLTAWSEMAGLKSFPFGISEGAERMDSA